MQTENVELMRKARESLAGKWGLAIGAFVAYFLIAIVISIIPFVGRIGSVLIGGPMAVGIATFALSLSRNEDAEVNQIFKGFENFGRSFITSILVGLFTILWLLLLIIPGLIAAYSYAMVYYILVDDASITPMAAIDQSKLMMDGYKMKLFRLHLRFFGWGLLCILTLGIGFLWLIPYVQVTTAKFYDDIKGTKPEDEIDQIGNYLKD